MEPSKLSTDGYLVSRCNWLLLLISFTSQSKYHHAPPPLPYHVASTPPPSFQIQAGLPWVSAMVYQATDFFFFKDFVLYGYKIVFTKIKIERKNLTSS